jgi:DHA2 family multidrug resistance protein-like MFS transporter
VDAGTIHRRRWGILAVLLISLLVVVIDNTVLNIALKEIQQELGASQSDLAWCINSYTLVFAGLLFTWGIVADRLGRKRVLLIGLLLFGLSSLLSAYASSPGQLIGARGLMGIGGAAVLPATLAIITNVFDGVERGRAIGVWTSAVGIAAVIGPVFGGLLLDHFWWGSVFLINVPIVMAGMALVAWLVPESRNPRPGRIDAGGVLLSMAGLVLLVYAIIEGGERASISTPQVYLSGIAGIALLALFVWYELRSDHPALDVRLFRVRQFGASVLIIGTVFFAMLGVVFFMVFYLQYVRGYSPLQAGLWFMPFAVAQLTGAPLSATFVARFGIRAVTTAGLILVTIALLGYQLLETDSPMWVVAAIFLIQGFGIANVMPPATTAIMASLPRERAGVGSAVNNTFRQVGGALGVAVLGSVLSVRYREEITPHLATFPEDARNAAGESLGATLGIASDLGPSAVAAIEQPAFQAFVDAIHTSALFSAGVALLSVVVANRFLPPHRRRSAPEPEAASQAQP